MTRREISCDSTNHVSAEACYIKAILLMALNRTTVQTSYEADKVIEPIYTGGAVALASDGRLLATTLGEDALLTDIATGQRLAKIEGVRAYRILR